MNTTSGNGIGTIFALASLYSRNQKRGDSFCTKIFTLKTSGVHIPPHTSGMTRKVISQILLTTTVTF